MSSVVLEFTKNVNCFIHHVNTHHSHLFLVSRLHGSHWYAKLPYSIASQYPAVLHGLSVPATHTPLSHHKTFLLVTTHTALPAGASTALPLPPLLRSLPCPPTVAAGALVRQAIAHFLVATAPRAESTSLAPRAEPTSLAPLIGLPGLSPPHSLHLLLWSLFHTHDPLIARRAKPTSLASPTSLAYSLAHSLRSAPTHSLRFASLLVPFPHSRSSETGTRSKITCIGHAGIEHAMRVTHVLS